MFYSISTRTLTTDIELGSSRRTYVIATDSATGAVDLSIPSQHGTFKEPSQAVIATSVNPFCKDGHIYSADINGDLKDDLLCHQLTANPPNVFSVRYYESNLRYGDEEPLHSSLVCDTQTTYKILIGDFDGNGADDIICFNEASTSITSDSYTYFNSACFKQKENPYHHCYRSNDDFRHGHSKEHQCPSSLPKKVSFPSGTLVGLDPSADSVVKVADINGDCRDDIVFIDASDANKVKYFLSTGIVLSHLFGSLVTPISGATCDETIIPLDADGDGDDDLVCSTVLAVSYNYQVAKSGNDGLGVFDVSNNVPCPDTCVGKTPGVTPTLDYTVGDFNADGSEDFMCRWVENNACQTGIFYSAPNN